MTNLIRLSLASLLLGWMIPGTSLASPLSIPQTGDAGQQTPSPQTEGGNRPEPPAKPALPQPNPDAAGKYQIGDGVSAPKIIYQVGPEFSEKARKKKLSGTCTVSLTVDTNGAVKDVHLIKSIADTVDKKLRAAAMELDENCIKTAEQYRFRWSPMNQWMARCFSRMCATSWPRHCNRATS